MNCPTTVSFVTFCTGDTWYLLPNELANFTVAYRVNRTMEVTTPTTDLRISNGATTAPGFMADFLTARATDPTTRLALRPDYPDNHPNNPSEPSDTDFARGMTLEE